MRRIRALTQGNPIFIVFDEPVRDGDGNLLGTVYLRDGTELNRILLQEGLGYVEPRDFLENRDLAEQHASEQIARESKVGIWSR
jgi:endonuclease YncB( thermonuclease family)